MTCAFSLPLEEREYEAANNVSMPQLGGGISELVYPHPAAPGSLTLTSLGNPSPQGGGNSRRIHLLPQGERYGRYPAILEKSASLCVVARSDDNSRSRLIRTAASSALTIT